jgi:hypothetical protein
MSDPSAASDSNPIGGPDKPIYDLAPSPEPSAAGEKPVLPKGTVVERAAKVGDKSLIDDFDEDADFTRDPQVERALGGRCHRSREI